MFGKFQSSGDKQKILHALQRKNQVTYEKKKVKKQESDGFRLLSSNTRRWLKNKQWSNVFSIPLNSAKQLIKHEKKRRYF